jgi:hypothetical protein
LLVMAWSPPALSARIVWVSAPGDYATFNSNHTPDRTARMHREPLTFRRSKTSTARYISRSTKLRLDGLAVNETNLLSFHEKRRNRSFTRPMSPAATLSACDRSSSEPPL